MTLARRTRHPAVLALAAAVLCAATSAPATATPTVWAKARDPDLDRRRALATQAEGLIIKRQVLRYRDPQGHALSIVYLRDARRLLEEAGAETARDPSLRLRYAEVIYDLALLGPGGAADATELTARAINLLEPLVRADMSAPMRANAWYLLAQSYGRLGRVDDEIRAYGEALNLEPSNGSRSVMLANRAEAYMLQGDLKSAVDGYRAALASITPLEMHAYGVTTLWGLAVALDRSGDFDHAVASIGLARSYDPGDRKINDETAWFYVPPYDEAWYKALGHWAAARNAELGAVRAEEYARAITFWEEYLARAPASDRWVPLAKLRLRMCEKERDVTRRKRDSRPAARARPAE